MPNIVDGQIDSLLRQVEERFQSEPSLPLPRKANHPEIGSRPKGGDLAVRQPQGQSRPATADKTTAGAQWFNLPKTNLTPEFKREWQLLRMRGLLDPKQQKKALRASPPEFSQVGNIIAGPTDFYSARLTRRERKGTLSEEIVGAVDRNKLRTKYAGIQRTKTSGKKAFYQRLVSQRRKRPT